MAVVTRTLEHAPPAHAIHHLRPRLNQAGLWLFFLSETFLFGSLFASRFYLAGTHKPEHLDQALGLTITSVLLLSSLTAYLAETSIVRGQRGRANLFLLLTIVLGFVFFGGVVLEWSEAHFTQGEAYGTMFFTMTGLHASHVLSGIAILFLVLLLSMRRRFSAERHWGVEASIKYWHFVDVVWVFFYPALYLV